MGRQGQEMWSKATSGFRRVCHALKASVPDEAGVTAIEYALLAALIVMVALGGITAVGNSALAMWAYISATVAAAT